MTGMCSICHIRGPEERTADFLCEQCADPMEIRTYCASCGSRTALETAGGLQLLAELFPDVAHDVGTTIRLDRCPQCITPGQNLGRAQCFRIQLLFPAPGTPSSEASPP
ncbi:hypothetical protein HY634_03520 [Candidatus Uhrbacteria bacterium]|nr:hypothetical protein [Candidatus Uhrbacteria bacterium]